MSTHSNVESNDLSGRNLQLLVNASLQVLIQQCFQLFVLLIEQASLFDQVLTVHQKLVVLDQSLVESLPHRLLLRGQNGRHLVPVPLNVFLLIR